MKTKGNTNNKRIKPRPKRKSSIKKTFWDLNRETILNDYGTQSSYILSKKSRCTKPMDLGAPNPKVISPSYSELADATNFQNYFSDINDIYDKALDNNLLPIVLVVSPLYLEFFAMQEALGTLEMEEFPKKKRAYAKLVTTYKYILEQLYVDVLTNHGEVNCDQRDEYLHENPDASELDKIVTYFNPEEIYITVICVDLTEEVRGFKNSPKELLTPEGCAFTTISYQRPLGLNLDLFKYYGFHLEDPDSLH